MKKRIFMLALVVGVLLSFSASAWATTYNYFALEGFNVPGTVYDAKVGNTVTVEFDIIVNAYSSTGEDRYQNANLLKWTVGDAAWGSPSESFKITAVTVTNTGVDDGSQDTEDASDYLFSVETTSTSSPEYMPNTLHIAVTGTVLKAGGSLTVKASLYNVNSGSEVVTTSNQDSATEVSDSSQTSTEITTSEEWGYSTDPANPDATDYWDGLDPTFTSDPGDNSQVKAKAKVKTTKFTKDFVSGTDSTQTIEITGPVTEIDVYIAAKDAIKLGWLEKGATDNIQLTQANIKTYNIPFRITSYDFSKNEDVLTGATKTDDKTGFTKDKNNAKNMKSTLTLAFNGGYFSMKGFPLTVAATNDEMDGKYATKTIKINVTPNTNTPAWYFPDTRDVTTRVSEDVTSAVEDDTIKLSAYTDDYTNAALSATGGTLTLGEDGDTYTVAEDEDGDTDLVVVLSYDQTTTEGYDHVITKSDKNIEIPVPLIEGDELGVIPEDEKYVYHISGDYGPFTITTKGDGKNGVTANVVDPVFNYRGEINKDNEGNAVEGGYVTFSGTLEKTEKESKTAVTLTVTNPSTKKKAAAKINVVGKLPATFDESKYPTSDDLDGMKVASTKYVEMGKIPSVKVKATGTKTITYTADGSNTEGLELTDVGLSFDSAKGAVITAEKGKKNTTPTVYYDDNGEPVFDPIPLYITADNGVGDGDTVLAYVGITGAKPKITTKSITIKKSERETGKYYPIVVNAGKSAPKYDDYTANIQLSFQDDDPLSDYGLKLATWEDLPNYVSNDGELIEDGATIVESGDTTAFKLYYIVDDVEYALSSTTYTKTNDYGDTVADFTTTALPEGATAGTNTYVAKGVYDAGGGDITARNKGYIMIEDASSLPDEKTTVTLKLIAENIGITNKGSVKLIIEAPDTTTTSARTLAAKAAAEEAAAKAKTSTAGGKNATLPDGAKAEGEDAAETAGEGTLTVGAARTAADLTAEQQAFLAAKGYKVIAVLPEVTVDKDGQYDLDEAELDEDAPEGEELIWIAFPKNAEPSEDDEIVDFYDEAGAPVEGVPASHKVIASPWLRNGVTYAPVIAIAAE